MILINIFLPSYISCYLFSSLPTFEDSLPFFAFNLGDATGEAVGAATDMRFSINNYRSYLSL